LAEWFLKEESMSPVEVDPLVFGASKPGFEEIARIVMDLPLSMAQWSWVLPISERSEF